MACFQRFNKRKPMRGVNKKNKEIIAKMKGVPLEFVWRNNKHSCAFFFNKNSHLHIIICCQLSDDDNGSQKYFGRNHPS